MLSVRIEVTEVFDFVRSSRVVLQGLGHLLEIGLLGLLTNLIMLFNRFTQLLGEEVETLNVGLDGVQLRQAVFLGESRLSATLVHFFSARHILVPNEVHLVVVLFVLKSNLLPETLDGHENNAMLTRLLQHLLRLLLVADHQQCLLSLDALQLSLLVSDLVREIKSLLASLFLEAIHFSDEVVHLSATLLVVLVQYLVGLGKARVPRVDLLEVSELVIVGNLHLLEEVFKLLKLVHLAFDAVMLVLQRLQLELCV